MDAENVCLSWWTGSGRRMAKMTRLTRSGSRIPRCSTLKLDCKWQRVYNWIHLLERRDFHLDRTWQMAGGCQMEFLR